MVDSITEKFVVLLSFATYAVGGAPEMAERTPFGVLVPTSRNKSLCQELVSQHQTGPTAREMERKGNVNNSSE